MSYIHRGVWFGGIVLGIGLFMYGWGHEESSRAQSEGAEAEYRRPALGKPDHQTQGKVEPFGQTLPGGNTGTGSLVKSLLSAPSQDESWQDGRSSGAFTPSGHVSQRGELEANGRSATDVEASAELRRQIAEELAEDQRLEREQRQAQEFAWGESDQDYDAPDSIVSEPSTALGSAEDNALLELDPELIELGIDAQGREIEEVEALADLRQELAEDFAEDQRLENLDQEQALANELARGDYDQDSGEDPESARQARGPLSEVGPTESGGGVAGSDGDGS